MKKLFLPLALILFTSAGCTFGNFTLFANNGPVGIIKTVDSGGNWQTANHIANNNKADISGLSIQELDFDPNDRQTLYAAAIGTGLWKSTDAAASWNQLLSKISALDFYVDRSNSSTIYVAGGFNAHGRIVKTTDGGKTWEELYEEASQNNAVNTVTANPNNTKEVYAGLNSGVLIKSVDGGINWFVVFDFNKQGGLTNLPVNDQIFRIRYNRLNNALYVLLRGQGIAKSTDGGVSWSFITGSLTSNNNTSVTSFQPRIVSNFVRMALDDATAGVIYITTSNGLYKTTDDGKTWVFLNVPVQSSAQLPRAIASSHGGAVAYTSIASTVFKTVDGGQSWQTEGLPTANLVNKIIIDPQLPQIVYAGLLAR